MLQSPCHRKVDGTVPGVILFRLTENSILMNEISEKTWNKELQQAITRENSIQRKLYLNEHKMEIQNSERRNSEYALFESQRELEPQRQQLLEADLRVSSTWERKYLCSRMGMKDHLHKKSYVRMCREIEELKRRCYTGRRYWKNRLEEFPTQHNQESRTVSSILLRSWLTEKIWRSYVSSSSSYHLEFKKA